VTRPRAKQKVQTSNSSRATKEKAPESRTANPPLIIYRSFLTPPAPGTPEYEEQQRKRKCSKYLKPWDEQMAICHATNRPFDIASEATEQSIDIERTVQGFFDEAIINKSTDSFARLVSNKDLVGLDKYALELDSSDKARTLSIAWRKLLCTDPPRFCYAPMLILLQAWS
jgi:hypothetical protein